MEVEEQAIRWSIKDNNGNTVILKKSTFENHVINDHSPIDAAVRAEIEPQIPYVISKPSLVVQDERSEGRIDYIGVVLIDKDEETYSVRTVVVVVDTDRKPWQVVTWFSNSRTTVKKRGVLYDYKNESENFKALRQGFRRFVRYVERCFHIHRR